MKKALALEGISLLDIEEELNKLKKKVFIFETLLSEKEIKKKKIHGPFKNGKKLINHIKS